MKMPVIAFGVLMLPLLSGAALAGVRDDVLEAMGRCAAIADSQARLACYDAAAPRLRDALATPPSSLGRPPTKQEQEILVWLRSRRSFRWRALPQPRREQFGKERTPKRKPRASRRKSTASLPLSAKYPSRTFGHFIVFLAMARYGVSFRAMRTGRISILTPQDNTVTISRGAIGSYNLTLNDSRKYSRSRA